jgi:type II secretion system protein H
MVPNQSHYYSPNQAFTLIEILVVLFIISIVATVSVFSINNHHKQQAKSFTQALCQSLLLAQAEAMLRATPYRVGIKQQMVNFSRYQYDSKQHKPQWVELGMDTGLKSLEIPDNVQLDIQAPKQQAITFTIDGSPTPFRLAIGLTTSKPMYLIQGDIGGNISTLSLE